MKYNASNYYYDGYAAYTNGLSHDQCQLEMGTTSRVDWYRGWRDAESDNRKKSSPSEIDSSNQQFESLATKQDEGWSAEGLPPVGCECEWLASGDHDWMKVRILAYHEDEVWLQPLNGAQSFTVGNPDDFRPIRTEAERMRKEAVDFLMSYMHHAGRAEVEFIYDAIAAGKIPHIKLESDHE